MRRRRHGITVLESAVVLATFLLLLFATLDLGMATFRFNMIAGATRELAREAIVHGDAAPSALEEWGPASYAGTAADDSEIAQTAAPLLPTMHPQDVAINVSWLDGDNQENDRVRVQMEYSHEPLVPFLSVSGSLQLRGESTMRVVH